MSDFVMLWSYRMLAGIIYYVLIKNICKVVLNSAKLECLKLKRVKYVCQFCLLIAKNLAKFQNVVREVYVIRIIVESTNKENLCDR